MLGLFLMVMISFLGFLLVFGAGMMLMVHVANRTDSFGWLMVTLFGTVFVSIGALFGLALTLPAMLS